MSENIQSQSPVVAPVGIKLLNTHEAAQVLGVSWRTVQNLIASGQLRSITVGRLRRIPVEAIEEFTRAGAAIIQSPDDSLEDFLRDLRLGTARVHGRDDLAEILSAHQRELNRRATGDPGTARYFESLRLVLAKLSVYSEKHIRRLNARKKAGVKATKHEKKAARLMITAYHDLAVTIDGSKAAAQD